MKEWLVTVTENVIVAIDILALVVVVIGTVEAFIGGVRVVLTSMSGHERRDIWLRYSRWLVVGLTFQLAADIIETSVTTSWEAVGRLGAVAVIRTFLNYFLERDIRETRELQGDSGHSERVPAERVEESAGRSADPSLRSG